MTTPLLLAQLTAFSAEGHGEYRVHGPARALAACPGVTVIDVDPDHRWALWAAVHADVLVLHHIAPDMAPLAARRRASGRATLLEASDHYLDPQPWSAYSAGWLDRTRQDLFWHLAAAVDAVQTSTVALADVWRPAARRVVVFPNRPPPVPPPGPRPARPLTIGWAGTATHLPDWYAIAPTVADWVRAHPPARLAVMTDELARGFVRLPPDRYAFRPPGSLAEYAAFLRELDVAVVPLLPSAFNRGRTDLKFAELAAAGVVGVFAAEGPYPDAVEHERTGFLYRTAGDLTAVLDRLAADPKLLADVRAAAAVRETVDPTPARLAAYRGLIDRPGNPEPPPELVAAAEVAGRYLRLPPGDPERASKAARAGGPADALSDVLRRHPDYVPGWRAAAAALLRAGRVREAVGVLEPLLGGRVESPELLAEAAHAYYAAGDPGLARRLAERAVGLNPTFAAVWSLLVRLAEPDGTAAGVASRAAANQPRNYIAALAPMKYQSPAERRRSAAAWLDRFPPAAHPEERPYLAAAFGRVIAELIGPDPDALDLLHRGCATFPESARLADAHAAALYAAGNPPAAAAEHARAAALARAADAFATEYPDPAAARRLWAVGEYAHAHPQEPARA